MMLHKFCSAILEVSEPEIYCIVFRPDVERVNVESEVIIDDLEHLLSFLAHWLAEVIQEKELTGY